MKKLLFYPLLAFSLFTAPSCGYDGCVDLGLPSGLLWTTCNIGASKPQDYGDYYAWGETETKSDYSWSTYKYCAPPYDLLTKYCNDSSKGKDGFTDALSVLEASDDIVTVKLGSDYRMPTNDEWNELFNEAYTYNVWTEDYNSTGVAGRIVYKKKNGGDYTTSDIHIFLPAAGIRRGLELKFVGSGGNYWSSSLIADNPQHMDSPQLAYFRLFSSDSSDLINGGRCLGFSVRAVRHK